MRYGRPLKRSKSGFEIELFVLSRKGDIVPESGELITHCRKNGLPVKKEASMSMIEIYSHPTARVRATAQNLLETLENVMHAAAKKGLFLYPHGVYPGEALIRMRGGGFYDIQKAVLGDERFHKAGCCSGFHQHYTLPRNMFNAGEKFLNLHPKSAIKQSLIDSYNMMVAVDPAAATLLQSSPFYQGRFTAKDMRMVLYRGGRVLKYSHGAYGNFQPLGALPPYTQTMQDLMASLNKKKRIWLSAMQKKGFAIDNLKRRNDILRYNWGPVKINALGTLEYRGCDVNHPKYLFSVAIMNKFILRRIQQDFLRVMPADIDESEAFKVEGNTVLVPSHTLIRNTLQYESAYQGLESGRIRSYCRRFFLFGKQSVPKTYRRALHPISTMLNRNETVSDTLIRKAKSRGHDIKEKLSASLSREIALLSASQLFNEVEKTKKFIEFVDVEE